ncbi:MAG: chemotaxis protein CheD [Methylobacter sp.]
MQIGQYQGLPRVIIDMGESYVTQKDEIISTLLGSCIATCLYDPINRIIGMNHFLLVQNNHSGHETTLLSSDAGRYGIHAMELLINKMLKQGADRSFLKAKAFGGGDILRLNNKLHGGKSVGAINCEFIKTFLSTEKIPLVASDLGGNIGRNIFFLPKDYSVYLKRIEHTEEKPILHTNNPTAEQAPQAPNQVIYW